MSNTNNQLATFLDSIGRTIIGEVVDYVTSKLILKGGLGGKRILDKLTHDALPRIC